MPDLDPLEQAKISGYVRSRDPDVRSEWYQWCKMHDQPYIEIQDRSLYARVNLDMITCEKRVLTAEGARRVRQVLYQYTVPFTDKDTMRDVHGGTGQPRLGMSIWSERIAREKAWFVAAHISTIVKRELVDWNGDETFAEYVPVVEG